MTRKDYINFKDWAISFGPVFKWDWETTLVSCGDGCTKDIIRVEKDPWRQATIKNLVTGKIVTWNVEGKPLRLYTNKERADLIRAALPYFEEE